MSFALEHSFFDRVVVLSAFDVVTGGDSDALPLFVVISPVFQVQHQMLVDH
jgi:hypothetical protein